MAFETLQIVWMSACVVAGLVGGIVFGRILFSRLCPEKPSKVFAELQKMKEEMGVEEEEEEEVVVDKQPQRSFPKGGYIKNGRFVPNKVPVYKKENNEKRKRSRQYQPGEERAVESEVEPVRGNEYPPIVDEGSPVNSRPSSRQQAANAKEKKGALTDVSNRDSTALAPPMRSRRQERHGGKVRKSKSGLVQPVPSNPTKGALPVPTALKKPVYKPRTTQTLANEENGEPEDDGGSAMMGSISELRQQKFQAAKLKAARELKEKRDLEKMQQDVQETYGRIAAKNNRTLGEFKPGKGKAASLDNYKPPSYAAAKARTTAHAKAVAHAEIATQRLAAPKKKKKGKKKLTS
jgi:hypothetical protein